MLGLKRVRVTIPLYLDHIDFKTGILIPLTGCLKFEGVLFIIIYFFLTFCYCQTTHLTFDDTSLAVMVNVEFQTSVSFISVLILKV